MSLVLLIRVDAALRTAHGLVRPACAMLGIVLSAWSGGHALSCVYSDFLKEFLYFAAPLQPSRFEFLHPAHPESATKISVERGLHMTLRFGFFQGSFVSYLFLVSALACPPACLSRDDPLFVPRFSKFQEFDISVLLALLVLTTVQWPTSPHCRKSSINYLSWCSVLPCMTALRTASA
jgi:hypothetical protein